MDKEIEIMPVTLNTTMTQISVVSYRAGYSPDIWGVDGAQKIFHYTGSSWTQIPGALVQVSASSDGTVWGVNAAGNVYKYTGANSWTQMPGTLVHVAVGINNSSGVWGVNAAGNVYQYNASTNSWVMLGGGPMKQVSAYWNEGGRNWYLMGLDPSGHMRQFDFWSNSWSNPIPNDNTSGTLVQVASQGAWNFNGLDSAGDFCSYQGAPIWWIPAGLPQKAKCISCPSDYSIALLDDTGTITLYNSKGE
ncbi:tectonin domain-containing protein [Sorangium sp. So ce1097]|uniref:tectonin domain-containing protein n=1 Tax=Sorangium sp. So ce1097 TaxID=3133330 RepID=UPI003F605E09